MRGRLARAARDPAFHRFRSAFLAARDNRAPAGDACLPGHYPSVGVYIGAGASHSWIWFADLLERVGLYDVRFIDERAVVHGLMGFDVLLVGGGDTYAMAQGMGERGAESIKALLREGGLYYGSCAGGYLVLEGVDLEPFTAFDLVEGWMANVSADPPAPRCLDHKYLARYGEEWVFHPVYGEVLLRASGNFAGMTCFADGEFTAPLFGGPVIRGAPEDSIVATYGGLTSRAAYLWPRERAGELVVGAQAVLSTGYSSGTAIASGPHLEHPLFPPANSLVAELLMRHCAAMDGPPVERTAAADRGTLDRVGALLAFHELERQVSNARIVAFGLEKMPVTWSMGLKVWEPEKLRMFLEAVWCRLPYVERSLDRLVEAEGLGRLAEAYGCVTAREKSLKIKIESGEDSQQDAISLLLKLKELTATFLVKYFRLRLEGPVDRAVSSGGWSSDG